MLIPVIVAAGFINAADMEGGVGFVRDRCCSSIGSTGPFCIGPGAEEG